MFYIASAVENDCDGAEDATNGMLEGWTCTLSDSYYTTFTMLLSTSWIHFNEPELKLQTILSMGFALVIGIFLLNVLIAEIGNVYTSTRERGRIAFWKKRLAFITEISFSISDFECLNAREVITKNAEMDRIDFSKVPPNIFKREDFTEEDICFFYWWRQNKDVYRPSFSSRLRVFFRRAEISQILLPGLEFERVISGEREKVNRTHGTRLFLFILFPIIPIVLTALFLLGFFSLGLFWPRWLKRYLFFGPLEKVSLLEDDVKDTKDKIDEMQSKIEDMQESLDSLLASRGGLEKRSKKRAQDDDLGSWFSRNHNNE